MSSLRSALSRTLAFFRKRRLDRDFDVEVSTHIELLIDEYRRQGLSDVDATHAAYRKLGRVPVLRDQHRDQRGWPMFDALIADIRYAGRMLWRAPAFTLIVTLSLALGIGANTGLFSLVDGLLLRELPVRQPAELVQFQVFPGKPGGGFKKGVNQFDRAVFEDLRARREVMASTFGFVRIDRPAISIDGSTEPDREVQFISWNYFQDLGVSLTAGRAPDVTDDNVAVISDRWRQTRFGGQGIGRSLSVNGRNYTVIGVAPARFHGFLLENSADLWLYSSGAPMLQLIGRLQSGVSAERAQASLQEYFQQALLVRAPNLAQEGSYTEVSHIGHGISQLREQYRESLWSLMALVVVVLLTTCTNVGNLLMLKSASRSRELTVRAALGAGRGRLVMQYLVESVMLAGLGCALGLLFARWGVSLIVGMLPLSAVPDSLKFYTDVRTVGFAIVVSLAAAVLFGLVPAWRATTVDLTGSLRSSQGTSMPGSTRRFGRVLVACQVGLSVVLLVAAGLFVQTLLNLSRQDLGFKTDHLLQVAIDTRGAGYGRGQVGPAHRLLLERVGAVPGVRSVTSVRNAVMKNSRTMMASEIPGLQRRPDEVWEAAEVGPAFFETMGYTLVRGRTFNATDFESDGHGFVINESFARHFFPGADPLATATGIVGIVRDAKFHDVRGDLEPMMFEKMRKEPDRVNTLMVRFSGDPAAVIPAVREAVLGLNPRLLLAIRTLQDDIDRSISRERMVAVISAFFSGLGLLLASIGIFGVASYTVAQRTKELAIRRALGADRWTVIRESLRETSIVFVLGLAAGTVAAILLMRAAASVMSDLLFGLTATSALNVVAATAVMIVVALVACLLPAYRATRIDPLAGIRES